MGETTDNNKRSSKKTLDGREEDEEEEKKRFYSDEDLSTIGFISTLEKTLDIDINAGMCFKMQRFVEVYLCS